MSGPLEDFFNQWDGFTYNPSAPAKHEFRRLCEEQGWPQDSPVRTAAYTEFRDALVRQFNESYGTDINDLNGWHAMMAHLSVDPLPDSVKECKKVVSKLFVNLMDLVDVRGDPTEPVRLFATEKELSKYTKRHKKFFPLETAKAGGVLKFLLRQIRIPRGQRR